MGNLPSNPIRFHCAPIINCCFRVNGRRNNRQTEATTTAAILPLEPSICLHRKSEDFDETDTGCNDEMVGDSTNIHTTQGSET